MPTVASFELSSRRIAATAATQGVYKSVKIRKLQAASVDEKSCGKCAYSCPESHPASMARVETTCSFAMNPEMSAVENFHSPNPNGLKITEIH